MLVTTLLVSSFIGLSFGGPGDPVVQRPGAGTEPGPKTSPDTPKTPGAPAVQRPGQKAAPVEEAAPEPEPEPQPLAEEPPPAPAPAPDVRSEPRAQPAVVATAAPLVQRPAKRPTWKAWAKPAQPVPARAPATPAEWSPFVGPDGPHVLPMSLVTRFAEPATPEWDGTYSPQVWEDEKAPVVKDPDLGRKKRERRNRRWGR